MNIAKSLFLFALLIVTTACGAESRNDWALRSTDGREIRLSEATAEKPVIVFFWASWCPYCKALMPHLQSLRMEYGDDVEILAVQIRDEASAAEYVEERGYDFTVLPNGDDVAVRYEISGTPGVLIVDTEQSVRFDLRKLPPYVPPGDADKSNHSARAALNAPYWAAELRKALDKILQQK